MSKRKISKIIEERYHKPLEEIIRRLYVDEKLSAIEISERFQKKVGVLLNPRSIQRHVKSLGLRRSLSDARHLAIQKGRMDYAPLRKSIKTIEYRKGIDLKTRYFILKRDKFRCTLCGQNAEDERLVIDHIIPIVRGGTNQLDNLRVLCRACNHGKMIYEREK